MTDREIPRRVFLERAAVLGGSMVLLQIKGDTQRLEASRGAHPVEPAVLLTLAAMAAQIVPTDQTPGAREANVVDYIQKQVEGSYELQKLCAAGVKEVDTLSQQKFGASFAKLDAEKEHEILKAVEESEFFKSIRALTVSGFYNSPEGWKSVGYPGMGQPHGHRDFDQPPKDAGITHP